MTWQREHFCTLPNTGTALRKRYLYPCFHRVWERWCGQGGQHGVSSVLLVGKALKSHAVVSCHFRRVIHMFRTAEGLLTQHDKVTANGLQEVFATNVFGHFLLVKCQ